MAATMANKRFRQPKCGRLATVFSLGLIQPVVFNNLFLGLNPRKLSNGRPVACRIVKQENQALCLMIEPVGALTKLSAPSPQGLCSPLDLGQDLTQIAVCSREQHPKGGRVGPKLTIWTWFTVPPVKFWNMTPRRHPTTRIGFRRCSRLPPAGASARKHQRGSVESGPWRAAERVVGRLGRSGPGRNVRSTMENWAEPGTVLAGRCWGCWGLLSRSHTVSPWTDLYQRRYMIGRGAAHKRKLSLALQRPHGP